MWFVVHKPIPSLALDTGSIPVGGTSFDVGSDKFFVAC